MLYHQFVLPVFTSEQEISFGFAVAKLAVPSFIMWLLGFYAVFHSMLNVCGELTGYPDRRFYLEWWNATTVEDFVSGYACAISIIHLSNLLDTA